MSAEKTVLVASMEEECRLPTQSTGLPGSTATYATTRSHAGCGPVAQGASGQGAADLRVPTGGVLLGGSQPGAPPGPSPH